MDQQGLQLSLQEQVGFEQGEGEERLYALRRPAQQPSNGALAAVPGFVPLPRAAADEWNRCCRQTHGALRSSSTGDAIC